MKFLNQCANAIQRSLDWCWGFQLQWFQGSILGQCVRKINLNFDKFSFFTYAQKNTDKNRQVDI